MKKSLLFFFVFVFCSMSIAQGLSRIVKGTITDGSLPLENVSVSIKDKGQGTYSDSSGKYTLEAKQGQRLIYAFNGMRTQEIIVEDVTRILNITLYTDFEQLDEVVVKQKRATTQRELEMTYFENKDLIKTVFGIIDTKRSNFTLRVLQAEDLNQTTFYIHDALQSLVPGLRIINDIPYLRGSRSPRDPSAVYEVNGMLFNNIDWLSINEVFIVGVILPGIGTQKYGLRASGGVIVINTKGGANILAQKVNSRKGNLGSSFSNVLSDLEIQNNWPSYLKDLYASKSLAGATKVYEGGKEMQNANPYYFIDAHQYFHTKWKSATMAEKVLSDGEAMFEKNAELLKAIAYINDVHGSPKKANQLYQEVFKLRPSYSQSYRDLANSYRVNEEYTKSVNIYSRYNHISELGMLPTKSSKFKELTNQEMYNLLDLNLQELKGSSKDVKQGLKKGNPYWNKIGIRVE